MLKENTQDTPNRCCSFCGLGTDKVFILIEAPTLFSKDVYICDQCVRVSMDLIVDYAIEQEEMHKELKDE